MAEKIRDFGEFIGGAQKDLWRQKGLSEDDLQVCQNDFRSLYNRSGNHLCAVCLSLRRLLFHSPSQHTAAGGSVIFFKKVMEFIAARLCLAAA